MADARSRMFGPVRRAGTLTAMLLALLACASAQAEDPREEAVVTLRSGGISVELQRAHSWSIQQIAFRGTPVATRTGAFGALACVPAAGGWVGSMHTQGGVERVEQAALIVDGEQADLTDGAVYTGERLVLQKRSMLDKLRLDAVLVLTGGVLTQRHELTATEDVVVTDTYPFMFPFTSETSRWIGATGDGALLGREFGAAGPIDWHDDLTWTAAFIPERSIGLVLRHLSREPDAGTLTGWWDHQRHHKLYVSWTDIPEPWPEGLSLAGEVALRCFEAPPVGWAEMAQQVASELVAQ